MQQWLNFKKVMEGLLGSKIRGWAEWLECKYMYRNLELPVSYAIQSTNKACNPMAPKEIVTTGHSNHFTSCISPFGHCQPSKLHECAIVQHNIQYIPERTTDIIHHLQSTRLIVGESHIQFNWSSYGVRISCALITLNIYMYCTLRTFTQQQYTLKLYWTYTICNVHTLFWNICQGTIFDSFHWRLEMMYFNIFIST